MQEHAVIMPADKDTTRLVHRWLLREVLGVVAVAGILCWSAGRLDWGWGWALVLVYGAWVAANAIVLMPRHPDLLAERASRKLAGMKVWDQVILSLIGVATVAKYVLAGLDLRHGWSEPLPVWVHVSALAAAAAGYAVITWAMAENAFFSLVVRIQEDRAHRVCRTGPYAVVRHPAYVGSILFEVAVPLLLGSWWALLPGLGSAVLTVVRTGLEDRTLLRELPGYADFAQQTRFRLVPGIW